MKYILVQFSSFPTKRKLLCLDNCIFDKTLRQLQRRYPAWETMKPPSDRTLRRWRQSGSSRCICGCRVRGLERCGTHNCMNWFAALIGVSK